MTATTNSDRLRSSRWELAIVIAAAFWISLAVSVWGQSVDGSISGRVTDPTKAVISHASVVIKNSETNAIRSIDTDNAGDYVVSGLPPGTYEIEVTRDGFSSIVKPGVVVHVKDALQINFELKPGLVSQVVTVTAGSEMVQKETSTLGRVVGQEEVQNLPLVSRNYTQILDLSAGVGAEVTNAANLGRNSQDVFVNGMGSAGNSFQMDGVEINNWGSNSAGDAQLYGGIAVPNPDSIAEFKVQTSLYDAASGRSVGANVEVVTKSGTNNIHGSLWEFFRNEALNANDFFSNLSGEPRSVLRQNQFGGTLGGPILKNKFFFFGSYQGTRQTNGVGANGHQSVVLPPLTNDRSATTLGQQFCGQSGVFGGVAVACDGSNINPAALNILNYKFPNGQYLIPTPQIIQSGDTGFSAFSIPATASEDQFMINTDYVLSSKHTLSERFFYSRSPEVVPFLGSNIPGFPYGVNLQNRNLALKVSSTLRPNLFNEAQFSYSRILSNTELETNLTSAQFGIAPPYPFIPTLLGITIGPLSISTGNGAESIENNFSASDQISWTRGRQTVRSGFIVQRIQFKTDLTPAQAGGITVLSFPDFLLGQSAAENGSSYSNIYASGGVAGFQVRHMRVTNWTAFVQDDIKLTPRLTLNAGLRWEIFGNGYDINGTSTNFLPELANNDFSNGPNYTGFLVPSIFHGYVPPGVVRNSNKSYGPDANHQNWGPRIGIVWSPLPWTDKVVLRAGYGIFYTSPSGNIVGPALTSIPPYSFTLEPSGAANAAATLQVPLNPPLPPESAFPIWIPRTPDSMFGNNSVGPEFISPFVQAFSLNVQEQLNRNLLLEIGYVGSRGTRLWQFFPFNQAILASPAAPVNGITTNSVENAYLRVPVQGAASVAGGQESQGFSWYNALQASLRKRFSHGLQFQVAYTWDKSLDDVGNSINGNGLNGGFFSGNAHDTRAYWGPSEYDRPQRLVLSYVWEIPGFQQRKGIGKLLGGWQASGVTTIQSGHRLTIGDPTSGSIYGGALFGALGPAQLCPGETNADIPTRGSTLSRLNNYVNANVFCSPPAISDGFGFGSLGRGVFAGPGQDNFDIAIAKKAKVGGLRDDASLEFRTEFFNAFNHPQFADPIGACLICGVGVGTPGFNQITSTVVAPRIIQFALKYSF
jgi:hypothetical protein